MPLTDITEPLGDLLSGIEVLPHLHFQRHPAERERILQPFFDLDVEPRIDTAVDELHRKVENHQ